MEKTVVSNRTAEVTATELPAFIAALPRLLTENLTITVPGGSCGPGGLYIRNFYGPGSLTVKAAEAAEVLCPIVLEVSRCAVPVTMEGFRLEGPSGAGAYVQVDGCRASFSGFTVDGANKTAGQTVGTGSAFQVSGGGMIYLTQSEIKNLQYGLVAQTGGRITASSVTASGNTAGVAVSGGGMIMLTGTTPELVGGTVNEHWGGLIVKKDGTLL